jgi:hypothetical protein
MRNAICSSLLAASVLLVVHPRVEARSKIPAELGQATYVALGYETSSGFVSENDLGARSILPQDREALYNVRQAVKKWGKYIVAISPDEAQILIVVRSARVASADGGIGVHRGSGGPTTIGTVIGAETGPSVDYLAVYDADHNGGPTQADPEFKGTNTREGAVLWRATEEGGLEGSDPSLFERLKKDVDSIAKKKKP